MDVLKKMDRLIDTCSVHRALYMSAKCVLLCVYHEKYKNPGRWVESRNGPAQRGKNARWNNQPVTVVTLTSSANDWSWKSHSGGRRGGYRADAIIKMDCKQVSFLLKQKEKKNRWPQTSSEIKAPFSFRFANISLGVGFYLYLLTKEKSGKYSIHQQEIRKEQSREPTAERKRNSIWPSAADIQLIWEPDDEHSYIWWTNEKRHKQMKEGHKMALSTAFYWSV